MKLCQECRKNYNEYHKEYAQKNKEKRREANKKYYLKTRGKLSPAPQEPSNNQDLTNPTEGV